MINFAGNPVSVYEQKGDWTNPRLVDVTIVLNVISFSVCNRKRAEI